MRSGFGPQDARAQQAKRQKTQYGAGEEYLDGIEIVQEHFRRYERQAPHEHGEQGRDMGKHAFFHAWYCTPEACGIR